ncbi:MAG: hypothetical protein QW410_00125 [Nitrososphaerota archaeon]
MASTYVYIVTIGVLMLIGMTSAYLLMQQVGSMTYVGQRNALAVAASHVLSGMWSAVEEAKLVPGGGVEYKAVSVGFSFRAEVGNSPRTGQLSLCVTAFGIAYERPLPTIPGVTYRPSGSGGEVVTIRASVSEGSIEITLGNIDQNSQVTEGQPTECFK